MRTEILSLGSAQMFICRSRSFHKEIVNGPFGTKSVRNLVFRVHVTDGNVGIQIDSCKDQSNSTRCVLET